jgi:hypothetical protein
LLTTSLRRHYPDQVLRVEDRSPPLSLVHQAPRSTVVSSNVCCSAYILPHSRIGCQFQDKAMDWQVACNLMCGSALFAGVRSPYPELFRFLLRLFGV